MAVREPVQQRVGMPLDEFVRSYDLDGAFEIIEGERMPLVPTLPRHGVLIKLLYKLLLSLESPASIRVFSELPFVLMDSSNWVTGSRVPDIMVYSAGRFEEYQTRNPDWLDKPFALVPDLCVEVVSKNDSYADVESKIARYLHDGVVLVWVFDPASKSVAVHAAGSAQRTRLAEDDVLTGSSVIAGFNVSVGSLFVTE